MAGSEDHVEPLIGPLLHAPGEVSVEVHGGTEIGMAEHPEHHPQLLARFEQERRGRVPQVVEPLARQAEVVERLARVSGGTGGVPNRRDVGPLLRVCARHERGLGGGWGPRDH